MAVMDTLSDKGAEKSNNAGSTLSQIEQAMANLPDKPVIPVRDPPVRVSIKKENIKGCRGPSPEKGSGQERFRQMLAGGPPLIDTSLNSSNHSLGINNLGTHGFNHPTANYLDPLSWIGITPDSMAYTNHVAVNPAVYPAAGSSAQPVPQPRMATPGPGGNRDFGAGDWVPGRVNNDDRGQTWTSILSSECQRRRFNPSILEFVNEDGSFSCSIGLNGITMRDSRSWSNPDEAKQSLARRAVEYVRKLPIPQGPPRGPSRGSSRGAGEGARARGGTNRAETRLHARAEAVNADDQRQFLARIQSLYGRDAGPSRVVMANPEASRAFLEGFALGCQLPSSTRDTRRRSRSPIRGYHSERDSSNRFFKRE